MQQNENLNSVPQLPEKPVDERFYCEGRLPRFAATSVWAIVMFVSALSFIPAILALRSPEMYTIEQFKMVLSFALGTCAFFSPVHIFLLRHTWHIDADTNGLLLFRIVGKKRIPWNKIEQINYHGKRHTVQDVVVDGVSITIPGCINSQVLTRTIEKCANAQKKHCHRDYQASAFKVLTSVSPVISWGIRFLGLYFTTLVVLRVLGAYVDYFHGAIIMFVLLPGMLLLHGITNLKRATAVRVTERGLGIKTLTGRYEIAWAEFNRIEVDEADKVIRVTTKNGMLTLGPELSNYEQLARQIEAKSREMAKARILQQDQEWEHKHVVAPDMVSIEDEVLTIQPS